MNSLVIRLQGLNLSHVIDGFGWAAERQQTPQGVTVYLDQILFDHGLLPAAPAATSVAPPTAAPPPTAIPASAKDLAVHVGNALRGTLLPEYLALQAEISSPHLLILRQVPARTFQNGFSIGQNKSIIADGQRHLDILFNEQDRELEFA